MRGELQGKVQLTLSEAAAGWAEILSADHITQVADALSVTLDASLDASTAADVILADDAYVKGLNRHYRGIDKPTNVLSFPLSSGKGGAVPLAPPSPHNGPDHEGPGHNAPSLLQVTLAGDVYLALETVCQEAAEQGKSPRDHAIHLIVHGFLHLLGFNHETSGEAARMEATEIDCLSRLGLSNPYNLDRPNASGDPETELATTQRAMLDKTPPQTGTEDPQSSQPIPTSPSPPGRSLSGHSVPDPSGPGPSQTPAVNGASNGHLLGQIGRAMSGMFRSKAGANGAQPNLLPGISGVLEGHLLDVEAMSPEERLMLSNLMRFGKVRVSDVMVPRADIVAVEENEDLEELVRIFSEAGHSRLPVYRETLDDPTGMVHLKDVVPLLMGQFTGTKAPPYFMPTIRRPVLFAPPSMPALDLLLRMQATRNHMALVIDEYGGTDGLLTIEDIVEEIVGDIEDEHDDPNEPTLSQRPDGSYDASARLPVDELGATLGLSLAQADDDEGVDTLGGLVFYTLNRVPERGEIVRHASGLEFEIIDADPRRIKKLRIRRSASPEPAGDTPDS